MICPYCNREMYKGVIYGDRYKLKWISQDKDKGILLQTFVKGIELPINKISGGTETFYCSFDNVFIIK